MYQIVVLSICKWNDQFLHHFRDFFISDLGDWDFDSSCIISEQCIIFVFCRLDDSFQTRMSIQYLIAGFAHSVQVYAFIQFECKRQVSGGISRDNISEIHLQTGQRIYRSDREIDLRFLILFVEKCFQFFNCSVFHQLCKSDVSVQFFCKISDQHDAAKGVQTCAVEVFVYAEICMSQCRCAGIIDLLLEIIFRFVQNGLLLFLVFLFLEEFRADNFLGCGFREWISSHSYVCDAGISWQFLIMYGNQFLYFTKDILHAVCLGIFVVRVNFCYDLLAFSVGYDVHNQTVFVKFILDHLRGNVLAIA